MTIRIFAAISILFVGFLHAKATSVPFRIFKKAILVEAVVNDKPGYFILDTGTPHLVLNNNHFKGQPTGQKVVGLVGGAVDIYERAVNLSMGDLDWNRIEAILLPLDHLSRVKGVTIMGLIGTSVLKNYELTIDFDASQLELVKVTKKHNTERLRDLPQATFTFIWRGGIPVIKTRVGDESFLFGFDTGAGINVIDQKKRAHLADYLTVNSQVKVSGMGKGSQSLQSGLMQNVVIENYYCPEMKVVLAPMARFRGFDSRLNMIDGFLGYEFLQYFRAVINFKKGTISLYQRNDPVKNYIVAR